MIDCWAPHLPSAKVNGAAMAVPATPVAVAPTVDTRAPFSSYTGAATAPDAASVPPAAAAAVSPDPAGAAVPPASVAAGEPAAPPPDPLPDTAVSANAPAVPVVHWLAPTLSHAAGWRAVAASRLLDGESPALNVGLLHLLMSTPLTSAPGTRLIWSNPASTRFIGRGE